MLVHISLQTEAKQMANLTEQLDLNVILRAFPTLLQIINASGQTEDYKINSPNSCLKTK